ncbi:MAG TPA: NAD-dependent epimerase/dehydratase family protein [Pyrinomonadaceae bacterium]|nr:NAD-dependent epimerase/dehydratase family protein [Pyrinomonadaceae bacterium]
MRALFTGGSSQLGTRVLQCVLEDKQYDEVWCLKHERAVPLSHPKLRVLEWDLKDGSDLHEIPPPLTQVIHFAAATHARVERKYWEINFEGTVKLMEAARSLGCRRFFYASTRCATQGSGAYGESKLAAELELKKVDWESLVIVRPAEIYGLAAQEGIDRMLQVAARFHFVPLLWGSRKVQFAPIHADDFVAIACALLSEQRSGLHTLDICGPEPLNGIAIASRIARYYRALPIPMWWPAVRLLLQGFQSLGIGPVTPDQIKRLEGRKTATVSSTDGTLDRSMKRFLRD